MRRYASDGSLRSHASHSDPESTWSETENPEDDDEVDEEGSGQGEKVRSSPSLTPPLPPLSSPSLSRLRLSDDALLPRPSSCSLSSPSYSPVASDLFRRRLQSPSTRPPPMSIVTTNGTGCGGGGGGGGGGGSGGGESRRRYRGGSGSGAWTLVGAASQQPASTQMEAGSSQLPEPSTPTSLMFPV